MYGIYEGNRQLEILNSIQKGKERVEFVGMMLGRNVHLVDMTTGEILESWENGERTYIA